jgi:tetratricopeptide (TPR) repeat protein
MGVISHRSQYHRALAVVPSRRIRLNKVQREAEGYLELGLPHLALDVLTRLGDPADFGPTTLYLWGEALRALGRYRDALEPLQRASQADPENIHIWLALAWCHKRTGRIDLAVEAISSALVADPNEAMLHYNLACYLSMSGEKNRALGHLSQALSLDPDYRRLIDDERDFDPIRADPEFQALTSIIV